MSSGGSSHSARRIRVLGSRHSFNEIADAPEHVSLRRLQSELAIDRDAGTVTCSPWLTYGELAPTPPLRRPGAPEPRLAPAHLAGRRDRHGDPRLGRSQWQPRHLGRGARARDLGRRRSRAARGEPDFAGVVVGLGATGVVTRVTLDTEPSYDLASTSTRSCPGGARASARRDHALAGESVSIFTRWGASPACSGSSAATRPPPRRGPPVRRPAGVRQLHPIAGADPGVRPARPRGPVVRAPPPLPARVHAERRRGAPVRYLFARADAQRCDRDGPRAGADIEPLLHVSEIRTVAARRAVDEPAAGPRPGRAPFHLAARAGRVEHSLACSRTRSRRCPRARTGESCSPRMPRSFGRAITPADFARCSRGSTRVARSATPGSSSGCWAVERRAAGRAASGRPRSGGRRAVRDGARTG